jgi:2-polyprenyl-3-methyl-5-hydroxy-6-metoxy-1,4-benzoquinol methylase
MSIIDRLSARFRPTPEPDPQPEDTAVDDVAPPVWELLSSRSGSHLYFLNPDHVQTGLLALVERPPRHVLDVGCYCGATGETIKRRWPGAWVTGIEPLSEAADLAAPRIDRVITGTLESIDFEEAGLARNSIDTIILADVLEHMFNPWQALQRLRELLTDDGVVLASIPNVRNLGLVHSLLGGHWTYAGGGLLDITHIRFFTLAEIRRMFAETGYAIDAVEHNPDPAFAQLSTVDPRQESITVQLGNLTLNQVTPADAKEFATIQFYVRARKSG